MSFHKEDYVATGNKVLDFFKNHPVFTYVVIGFILGGVVVRLVHG